MDRDEALRLLRGGEKGVEEWNQRRNAGEEIPDLSKADLARTELSDANLSGTILSSARLMAARLIGAQLRGTILSGADFSLADLRLAVLSEADLRHASLTDVNLGSADLSGADFSGADLISADLVGANLVGTDLSKATCLYVVFGDVDLSKVKGLESVRHSGPSYLSTDTLIRSRGQIPESFLRGCGLPEHLIEYLPSLISGMQPIQFYSCFISYSSKDTPFAERLYADLQAKGVRCWFAPEDLKIGEKIRPGIDRAIQVNDKLLLVLSKHSVESEWVEKEVETAMEKERSQKRTVLFPVRLDEAVMKVEVGWPADVRRSRNIGDFRKWKQLETYQKAFDRLLKDLKAEASVGQP